MTLVNNWHRLYRSFSVQAMGLALSIQAAWPLMPDDLKAALPHDVARWVSIMLLVAGILGRGVDQGGITDPKR